MNDFTPTSQHCEVVKKLFPHAVSTFRASTEFKHSKPRTMRLLRDLIDHEYIKVLSDNQYGLYMRANSKTREVLNLLSEGEHI